MKICLTIACLLASLWVNASTPPIDSLLKNLAIAKDDTAKVWLLHDLSRIYSLRNVDSSNLFLNQAASLSDQLHFYRGKVASLHRLSSGTGIAGDTEGEIRLLRDALRVALEHDVKDWQGRCYKRIGDTFRQGMKADSALHYYNLAENANLAVGTEYYNWMVFMEKARLFEDQHQPEKTEHYFREALQLTSQRKVRMDYGLILFHITSWYWRTKQWEKYAGMSETYLKFLAEGDKQAVGKDAAHAMLYFFEENATPASKIPVLKTIIRQHETLGNHLSLANTWKVLGDYSLQSGDLDGALAAQKQAATGYGELGYLEQAALCTKSVSDIYEAKKDYASALTFFKKYQTLNDSLNTLATQKNMQELEVRFETGKKEATLVQQRLELEKQTLARRNLTITVLALALAGLAALGFLYFKSKTNRALQSKNEIISSALSEKELLLREIHHRVKNNLQVISSLLHLQSKYIRDEKAMEAIREGRNRVKSMALIHQNLYQNEDLTSVEVAPYLQKLTEGLFQSYNISPERIHLRSDVDAARLDVDTLVPLGLIINELVSNSLKHAFPGERRGEVTVSLKNQNHSLMLEVRDDGVGFSSEEKKEAEKSFGFEMVKTFAAKLKASLQVENFGGTSVRLVIPQV